MVRFSNPIKLRTAQISMTLLGLMIVVMGLFPDKISIFFSGGGVTGQIYGLFGLFAVALILFEVGVKKFTSISKLKKLTNQQVITLSVAGLVLVASLVNIFWFPIYASQNLLGFFNNGALVVNGFLIVLEAYR